MRLARVPFFGVRILGGFTKRHQRAAAIDDFQREDISTADLKLNFNRAFAADTYHRFTNDSELNIVKRPTDGGVIEIIPAKFQPKYQKWKGVMGCINAAVFDGLHRTHLNRLNRINLFRKFALRFPQSFYQFRRLFSAHDFQKPLRRNLQLKVDGRFDAADDFRRARRF